MTHHKDFKNESQDARRRDKHNETHPDEKMGKNHDKSNQNTNKSSNSSHTPRK